jgi:isoleucyl-tRNA synthetase
MFPPLPTTLNLTLMEEDVLRFWRRERIFAKASARREGGPEFVFYEGPPTANGAPGVHHVLARAYKDVFPRYKTMRGCHVVRRGGWDTHGLPVEIEVEKRLGITTKSQIETYGIARFNQLCRKSAFDYIQDWERLTDRIGFWVDLEDAYVTFTNDYIESLWWILKTFWDKGLLYQAEKVVPYCPRCGTPLSDHEVAQGYAEVEDPSIYLRLPLVDEPGTSLLVWTTTPWTLPGNIAVAAHPELEYVKVERALPEGGVEQLILAGALLESVFPGEQPRVIDRFKGRRLKGRRYRPLFTFLLPEKPAYFVVLEEFVTAVDGTGLVHLAPAFGAEDLQAAQDHDLPRLETVGPDGVFLPEVRPFSGRFVKDAEPHIVRDLEARGLVLRSERLKHTYPFCWRCDTPLIYYARPTWFLRTTQYKDKMVELNRTVNWVPGHIRDGRFGNWLENNVDWALGRERYWGTPLPVWECETCHHRLCVGSVRELEQLAGQDLSLLDLHRPFVDEVRFPCPECGPAAGDRMQRVAHLVDAWFDSGAMPVAQWHFPFENQETFKEQFPADFICEAVDQTRGWFYSLHAVSTLLFEEPAYKNAISLGLVLDSAGQKMSKSRGNWIDPWGAIDKHGADALRWHLYTAAPPGQERRLSAGLLEEGVRQALRGFTLTLWNVYAFFVTYANLAGWSPNLTPKGQGVEREVLDRWLLSELHALIQQVTSALEAYDVPEATRPVGAFVEVLSGWYLRRSRQRFSESATEEERRSAFTTLYETLVALCKLLAPSMPFLAEELYQHLVRPADPAAPESVHLADWPEADQSKIDPDLNGEMRLVMKLASIGHAARSHAGIQVRQPLAEAAFSVSNRQEARLLEEYAPLLADELNVRSVRLLGSSGEAVAYSLKPLPRQLGGKYKALFPRLSAAILDLDTEGAARALLAGHNLLVAVDGKAYTILPEDVEVRAEARSGYTAASDGAYLAALRTELTPELEEEGLVRELLHRLQNLRKRAGLKISDRIRAYIDASPRLAQAVEAHHAEILVETRAVSLEIHPAGDLPEAHRAIFEFGGETATVAIAVAETDGDGSHQQ